MAIFDGHKDKGIQRLFIEMPDEAKNEVAWKWPDHQIIQHSILNVDLDYQAVFTNLGKVIGVLGPGRHPLDEGASLSLGWLVDRLTGNAYYDTEVYFITTRDMVNQEFGGPVDNIADGPTGLVVSLRVFGELAYRVSDPTILLSKLVGTGSSQDLNSVISTWVEDQALAAIRAVLPDLVMQHGVLAMGQIQDSTGDMALPKANEKLASYGLAITNFAQLNVNLPDADAQEIKQFAAAKAYTGVAGSFDSAVRGESALEIAQGVAQGHVGAQPAVMTGMMMGVPGSFNTPMPPQTPVVNPISPMPSPANLSTPDTGAHFCSQCGTPIVPGSRFCSNCGSQIGSVTKSEPLQAANAVATPETQSASVSSSDDPPGVGYWKASDGNWYPPSEKPGQ